MARPLSFLPGPELIWCCTYLIVVAMARLNVPPSKSMDSHLENLFLYIPIVSALIFGLWYIPTVEKDWLLLRVWLGGLIGAHYVLEKGLGAHSTQGPGIGTAYIAGMLFVFFVLIGGTVFVKIRF